VTGLPPLATGLRSMGVIVDMGESPWDMSRAGRLMGDVGALFECFLPACACWSCTLKCCARAGGSVMWPLPLTLPLPGWSRGARLGACGERRSSVGEPDC
jgi:hypothetical protein